MTGQQLKNSILQLAIEGKLVSQDPNDEPASVLLQRIREEKQRLVKEGKLKKKDLTSTPITDEEKPFDIPETWEWVRMGELILPPKYGTSSKSKTQGELPVLRMGNIQNGEIVFDKLVYSDNEEDNSKYLLDKGDLLFNRTNSAELVGKTAIYRGEKPCIYAGYLILLRPIIADSEYLNYVFSSPYVRNYCKYVKTIGVQQCNINAEKVSVLLIPLPPLSEQRRIVARIEELMPLVEAYGKAQEELEALNAGLPEALKKSILQEAIQGRLVPQDTNDEPASVLLARIRKEKEQLVKAGKLKKKDLTTTPIPEEEKPFDIPETWEWVKVCDIFQTYSGGTPDKGHPEYYNSKDVKWAKVGDLGSIHLSATEEFISSVGMENSSAKLYPQNTVLVAMYCNDAIGKSSIVKSEMASNQAICGILPNPNVLPEFLYYVIQEQRQSLIEKSAGGAQKNINQKIVNNIAFPLPPLSEQRRIVAKIENLFAAIDQMKDLH